MTKKTKAKKPRGLSFCDPEKRKKIAALGGYARAAKAAALKKKYKHRKMEVEGGSNA